MRISLCVICGNEQEIITRLLDSFSPAFDELSLARAVGNSKPDETKERAEAWCRDNGKAFVFSEYKNHATGADLGHIDDFAAARNLAFNSATGDWLFWADCDDLCHAPDRFRETLKTPECGDLLRFPYDVVGTGKRPMRERAIRRSALEKGSAWCFAVHENLRAHPGATITDHEEPVWIHQPRVYAVENRKRNKAILARVLSHSSTNYFYLHQEWFCEGNKRNAEKFGALALSFPDLEPSFRYEANLNLARMASDTDDALRYAFAAHGVFPWCREALALLALTYIDRNDAERALWFARLLDKTEMPSGRRIPWTHEPKWYGWAGNDLLARCLRLSGDADAAKEAQRRDGKPVISLLHATRGRPQLAGSCRSNWLNLAADAGRIQHIFAVDEDDAPSVKFARQFEHVVSKGKSCVAAWNLAAEIADGDLLVQLSDDWVPVPGWDAKLLAEIEHAGKTTKDELIVAISDGHRTDDLLCMAIATRARVQKQDGGTLFWREYESVYSDNEFSHRGWRDGVVIDARSRLTFKHQHPAFGAAPLDRTYAENNSRERYESGKRIFTQRNPDAKQ